MRNRLATFFALSTVLACSASPDANPDGHTEQSAEAFSKVIDPNKWTRPPLVLCGFSGEACCETKSSTTDGTPISFFECSDGSQCNPSSHVCGHCGNFGENCCGNGPCVAGLQCNFNTYVCDAQCGAAGQACCHDTPGTSDAFCNGEDVLCASTGTCAPCGAVGQPACRAGCRDAEHAQADAAGICRTCGAKGTPPCVTLTGQGTQVVRTERCDAKLAAPFGTCEPCGAKGDVTCSGACDPGLEPDEDGLCAAPWGRAGQACSNTHCRGDLRCYNGVCDACGHLGWDCCTINNDVETSYCKDGLACGAYMYNKAQCLPKDDLKKTGYRGVGNPPPPSPPQCDPTSSPVCGSTCPAGSHPVAREIVAAACGQTGTSPRVSCVADCGTSFETCMDHCPPGYVSQQTTCKAGVCGTCGENGTTPNWSSCVKR